MTKSPPLVLLSPAPPRERMTPRARFYMAVVAARTLLLGLFCVFATAAFTSGSYAGLMSAFHPLPGDTIIRLWGVVWIIIGVTACYATITGRDGEARAALLLSIVASACWATGFTLAIMHGVSTGPTGVIVWWALVFKDGTMLRQPLRNPFEPLVRRLLRQEERRDGGSTQDRQRQMKQHDRDMEQDGRDQDEHDLNRPGES